jgi:DNA-binding response OmpR family regulator
VKELLGIEGAPTRIVTLLAVSPVEEDHACLQTIFSHSKWLLCKASTLASALTILRERQVPVILCERDLLPGTWKDMLEHLSRLPSRPVLLVASRLADEHLWAEALNLGAYDVLAKPFDPKEIFRSVSLAWLHWKHQYETVGTGNEGTMGSALHWSSQPGVARIAAVGFPVT